MKKVLVILLVFGLVGLTCNLHAGWPINRTPKIEGVVTDTTTGKPIENVVVSAQWVKKTGSIGGYVRSTKATEIAITDKEGKYTIPAKTTIHFLSSFAEMWIHVAHPLYTYYDTKTNLGYICVKSDGMYRVQGGEKSGGIEEDGIIKFDIPLISLEEKYVEPLKKGTEKSLKFLDIMRNQKYLLNVYKEKKVKINIDEISEIYKKWSSDFPQSKTLKNIVQDFIEESIKYKKNMENEK